MRLLIDRFALASLPVEGVLFANTHRSEATTPAGAPAWSVGIGLFCDDPPSRSLFHRLAFDEVWHFYGGDPFRLVLLHPDGSHDEVVMGDVAEGRSVQQLVPAGTWQAGELLAGGAWALFGCMMAPGFTDGCFEGGTVAELERTHPGRAADIERLGLAG